MDKLTELLNISKEQYTVIEGLRSDLSGLQGEVKEAHRNAYNASVDNSKLIGKITLLEEKASEFERLYSESVQRENALTDELHRLRDRLDEHIENRQH